MGNDILTHTHKPKKYIEHRKLELPNHLRRTSSSHLQNIFGSQKKMEYMKSQSAPIFEVERSIEEVEQVVVEEENEEEQEQEAENTYNTFTEINEGDSLPFRQTIAMTSINTQEQNDIIHEFQNHVNELKTRLFEQNFNSRNFSPVKYQEKSDLANKTVNKSTTRNKQHYFRLKGCESTDKQNQI